MRRKRCVARWSLRHLHKHNTLGLDRDFLCAQAHLLAAHHGSSVPSLALAALDGSRGPSVEVPAPSASLRGSCSRHSSSQKAQAGNREGAPVFPGLEEAIEAKLPVQEVQERHLSHCLSAPAATASRQRPNSNLHLRQVSTRRLMTWTCRCGLADIPNSTWACTQCGAKWQQEQRPRSSSQKRNAKRRERKASQVEELKEQSAAMTLQAKMGGVAVSSQSSSAQSSAAFTASSQSSSAQSWGSWRAPPTGAEKSEPDCPILAQIMAKRKAIETLAKMPENVTGSAIMALKKEIEVLEVEKERSMSTAVKLEHKKKQLETTTALHAKQRKLVEEVMAVFTRLSDEKATLASQVAALQKELEAEQAQKAIGAALPGATVLPPGEAQAHAALHQALHTMASTNPQLSTLLSQFQSYVAQQESHSFAVPAPLATSVAVESGKPDTTMGEVTAASEAVTAEETQPPLKVQRCTAEHITIADDDTDFSDIQDQQLMDQFAVFQEASTKPKG